MQQPEVKHESPSRNNPFICPRGDSRPIHRLPFELLSRTFEFSATYDDRSFREMSTAYKYQLLEEASGEERLPKRYISTPRARVILSHVCRHWRNVAISTLSLWTSIRVDMESVRPPYNLVSLHLERSKHLPIDIRIDAYTYNSETTFSDAKLLYALLVPHVHRWRSIDLRLAKSQHMSAFLATVSSASTPSALQLESLRLQHYIHDMDVFLGDPMLVGFQTLFNGSAPRLRHLMLSTLHVNWSQTLISAASNLTSLELFHHFQPIRPSWTEFATILRGAPTLQKLALYHSAPLEHPDDWVLESRGTSTTENVHSTIPLLHLTEFVLGSQPQDVAVALLRNFHMPSLTTLILDLDDGDCSDVVHELIWPTTSLTQPSTEDPPSSLLTRLERLAILNLPCADEELMFIMFEGLENLKRLRLAVRQSEPDPTRGLLLLESLIPLPPGPPEHGVAACELPQLESLLVCPSQGNVPFLRKLVQARKEGGAPLRSLYIAWNEDIEREDTEWFRERLETFGFVNELYCRNTGRAFEGD